MAIDSTPNLQHDGTLQREVALALFLLIFAIYLLTGALRIDSGDGEAMYQVTRSMVEGRGFTIPPPHPQDLVWGPDDKLITTEEAGRGTHGHWGADGQFYTVAGLGWSLAAVPFYVLGAATAQLIPGATEGYVTRAVLALMNTLILSIAVGMLFLVASRFYPISVAVFISLAYALGTIAWAYARGTFSEPIVALGLLWAVFGAIRAGETQRPLWWGLAGLGLGAAVLSRQAAAVMALPFGIWALLAGWRTARLRGALSYAVALVTPLLAAQAGACAYNLVRWGDPLSSGYNISLGESKNLLTGLFGLLLSPGKGLPVFVPLTFLGFVGWPLFMQKRPALGAILLTMILFQLVLYASTSAWAGGLSWGPRHLVPVLAFLLLPIGEVWPVLRQHRWLEMAASFLLAASLLIQLLGISVNPSRHEQVVYARTQNLAEFSRRVYRSWPESPIPGQIQSLLEVRTVMREPESLDQLRKLIDSILEQDPRDGQANAVGYLSFNVPDFWFVYWGYLGVGIGWRIAVAAALGGLAVWAGIWLRRLLHLATLSVYDDT
jgi:hypothetical protein